MKLQIFALAFTDEQFAAIPISDNIMPVNLSKLKLIGNIENSNQLCEHRIFLSELPSKSDAEYFAFVTWRHHEKYPDLIPITEFEKLDLERGVVWVSDMAPDWFEQSMLHHPGIGYYINELQMLSYLNNLYGVGFWSNQFICHRDIYFNWQSFFRNWFTCFNIKYGFNFQYSVIPEHENRKAGVFYERFSSLYFSNHNLFTLKQIPGK